MRGNELPRENIDNMAVSTLPGSQVDLQHRSEVERTCVKSTTSVEQIQGRRE